MGRSTLADDEGRSNKVFWVFEKRDDSREDYNICPHPCCCTPVASLKTGNVSAQPADRK